MLNTFTLSEFIARLRKRKLKDSFAIRHGMSMAKVTNAQPVRLGVSFASKTCFFIFEVSRNYTLDGQCGA